METPPAESTTRSFGDIPLDLQRTVIDYCIANKVTSMTVDGAVFELPHMLQLTYRCKDSQCNNVVSARFFCMDIVSGGVTATRRCTECKETMYISHKTAVLDYYLGPAKKKKLKGLEMFLFKQIQQEKEQYGPKVGD